MNASVIMKQTPLIQEMTAAVATKYWNSNCKTCIHFQKYKHPLQELHYKNSAIGECKKMNTLVYTNNTKPKCGGILYEEK
jgi:hypothetical protein